MSTESLAAFRKSGQDELSKLAEEHMQHDLQQSDRDALRNAASKLSTYATVGSLLGLGLCVFMAYRLRTARNTMFKAFRAREKPTRVQFADGRTGGSSPLSILPCAFKATKPEWIHLQLVVLARADALSSETPQNLYPI